MLHQLLIKKTRYAYIALYATLAALFWAGLNTKSFHYQNALTWGEDGLIFGPNSIAYSDEILSQDLMKELNQHGFVIELGLKPSPTEGNPVKVILEITAQPPALPLIIWQWQDTIIAMNGYDYANRQNTPRISATLGSGTNKFKFIVGERTQLKSDDITIVDLENSLIKFPSIDSKPEKDRQSPKSRIVLGNSAQRQHSWTGSISELSISRLPDASNSTLLQQDHIDLVRYVFTGQVSEKFQDLSGNGYALHTPEEPIRLKRMYFETKWSLFNSGRFEVLEIAINCLGFVPLGFLLATIILPLFINPHIGGLVTLGLGFSFSFVIELCQSRIPARYSSMQDLALNFTGTVLGLALFIAISKLSRPKKPT